MMPSGRDRGRLLLVPNTLDHGSEAVPIESVLPLGVLEAASALQHWIVEDARSARAFLGRVAARVPLSAPLQSLSIVEMPRARKGSGAGVPAAAWHALLEPAASGSDIGLLSEAGLPGVADPGASLVEAAHARGIEVVALPGPSSLMLALAASGLNGQGFTFVGYVPQDPSSRVQRVRQLESVSRQTGQTQILIETPYRNAGLAETLLAVLAPTTLVSISTGLTLPHGWSRCLPVESWRRQPPVFGARTPAVFALLAR